jgi:4,5-DOPA dioxygenase extradiol
MTVIPFTDAATARSRLERRGARDVRAPALFLSHGAAALAVSGFGQTLRRFGTRLRPPRGIVVVSAQWQEMRPVRVTAHRKPTPLRNFEVADWATAAAYPCPGSPGLAEAVVGRLGSAGVPSLLDATRGLDAAAWVPVSAMFPSPRVPVVAVSLPAAAEPSELVGMGRALAPLRREGFLLVGSGGLVHNPGLARSGRGDGPGEPWALAFDEWARERLEGLDVEALVAYRRLAPQAHLAAPTSTYLDPLFFVLGARLPGDRVHPLFEGFLAGTLSLRSFVLAGRRADDHRLPDALTLPDAQR